MASFGERLSQVFKDKGQLCVGIDPSNSQLLRWGLEVNASGARDFSFELIDSAASSVGIVKPQIAFFEQFGSKGFKVLEEVLDRAKNAGLVVVADAKRGDIGSTMEGYANAWIANDGVFFCDALTVSPYLGPKGLLDTAHLAIKNQRGLFVLAATSNPEAISLQQAKDGFQTVASKAVEFAKSLSTGELGSIGVVIGATIQLEDFGISEQSLVKVPVLMPGFGSQGVDLKSARNLFPQIRNNLICSASRSIAGDSRKGLEQRISAAVSELELGLST